MAGEGTAHGSRPGWPRPGWPRTLLLAASIVLVVVATLLPAGIGRGSWIHWCVTCGLHWLADAISNVVLFVPLGASLALCGFGAPPALLIGSGLSLAIELLQLVGIPPSRTPSLSDWLTNSAGTGLGAILIVRHALLLHPSRVVARRFLWAWTTISTTVLVGSGWMLSPFPYPVGPPVRVPSDAVTPSTLPFTPGFGWFAGLADSATVDDVAIPHVGTGPVIARVARADTIRAVVQVRGRDLRAGIVPIVYVHAPDVRVPALLLGQQGSGAIVRSTLRARRLGLRAPDLFMPDVFSADARGADDRVRLEARVVPGQLSLTAREGDERTREQHLRLSPALGWTLIQPVLRVDSPIAPLLTVAWLLAWLLPGGYWAARALDRAAGRPGRAVAGLAWGLIVVGAVLGAGAWIGSPQATALDVAVSLGAALLGSVVGNPHRPVHGATRSSLGASA